MPHLVYQMNHLCLVAERVSNRMELATGSVLYKHWSAEPFQVLIYKRN
jgi:hypothetical protein